MTHIQKSSALKHIFVYGLLMKTGGETVLFLPTLTYIVLLNGQGHL